MNIFVMRHPSPRDNGPINLPPYWCSFIKMKNGCWHTNTSFTAETPKWDHMIGKASESSFGEPIVKRFDSVSLIAPMDFCDERILNQSRSNIDGDRIIFMVSS